MPGVYKVSIAKRVGGVLTPLSAPQTFNVTAEGQSSLSGSDRTALLEFQQKVARLQRAVSGALETSNSLKPRLVAIRRALLDTPSAGDKLLDDASGIDRRVNEILRALRGDPAQQARNQNTPPSINDRVSQIIGEQRMAIARPTGTHVAQYGVAAQEFEQTLAQLRTLIEVDLNKLEKAMEAAGAPHTPGRIPEWKEQ